MFFNRIILPDIGPHALATISGVPTNFPIADLNVTYTDFKKIATLQEGNNYYTLSYGVDDQRRKSEYSVNGVLQQTRYYVGNYEEEVDKNGNVRKIHYLSGAILIQNNGMDSLLYTYSDFQGTLLALLDVSGAVVEKYAFDPWGVRRNPADWSQNDLRTKWIVNRGYTGHEHLDVFGIINMNGRVYDPLTAQFFSPDPYVQAPGDWLNYNRYGYCYGNPFRYTDPSGKFIFTLICIFVPGMQVFLPYAVAADIAWMSEYGAQVANNITLAHQNGNDYSAKDIFLGQIDWFDVGTSAVSGGVSIVPGLGWVTYATPILTNAVNIKGNGSVETIFGGNNKDGKGGKIDFGRYLGNTVLEVGAIGATSVFKSTLGKNSSKDIVSNLPKNTLNNMSKKGLWQLSSKELFGKFKFDGMGTYFGKLSQDGFEMEYNNMINNQSSPTPYDPYKPNPFIPNNPEFPNRINRNEPDRNSLDINIYNLSSAIR